MKQILITPLNDAITEQIVANKEENSIFMVTELITGTIAELHIERGESNQFFLLINSDNPSINNHKKQIEMLILQKHSNELSAFISYVNRSQGIDKIILHCQIVGKLNNIDFSTKGVYYGEKTQLLIENIVINDMVLSHSAALNCINTIFMPLLELEQKLKFTFTPTLLMGTFEECLAYNTVFNSYVGYTEEEERKDDDILYNVSSGVIIQPYNVKECSYEEVERYTKEVIIKCSNQEKDSCTKKCNKKLLSGKI